MGYSYRPLPGDDPILDLLLFGVPGAFFMLMSIFGLGAPNLSDVLMGSASFYDALGYVQFFFGVFLVWFPIWIHRGFWIRGKED